MASPMTIQALTDRCLDARSLLLLLDYDGTLVPFAPLPHLGVPDPELRDLLARFGARPGTETHIVSGRERGVLESWFDGLPLGLHAEHGSWSRPPGATEWKLHEAVRPVPFDDVLAILTRYSDNTPGATIERKSSGLAWHYRGAAPELGRREAEAMLDELSRRFSPEAVNVLHGDMVVEIRPAGVHKGLIVTRLAARVGLETLVVALGDDATDEDMFRALPPGGVGVHVGPRPSIAEFRLPDVAGSRAFLAGILGPAEPGG